MASRARLSLRALVLVVALLVAALATATATARRTFDFNADGTFKIVQLADMHYSAGELATCRDIPESAYPCSDRNTTDFIGRVLDVEQPDLAVYTGDNLDRPESVAAAIEAWAAPCIERGIPWAAILGNHDDDRVDLNRRQIMDVIVSLPYAVSEQGPADVYGASNYLIQLLQPAYVSLGTRRARARPRAHPAASLLAPPQRRRHVRPDPRLCVTRRRQHRQQLVQPLVFRLGAVRDPAERGRV